MRFDAPLDDLFSGPSAVRVLRALVELPAGFGVSAREIARRAEISHPTASKVLGSLVAQGVVGLRRSLQNDEYSLSADHVLARTVADLFAGERSFRQDLIEFLSEAIPEAAPSVERAFLYGSVVAGGMAPDSDVDLAVVSPSGQEASVEVALEEVAEAVRNRYGNRLSVLMGSVMSVPAEGLTAFVTKQRSPRARLWTSIPKAGIEVPLATTKTKRSLA
jgi:DNA-binding transcriptional ArsR family regulator